jgi:hypothetical protein
VSVERDHVHHEGIALTPVLAAQLAQTAQIAVQRRRIAARVHPAVADAGCAAQRGLGVAADQDRNRLARHRADLHGRQIVVLAVELELAARERRRNRSSSMRGPRHASGLPQIGVLGRG